MSVDTTPPGPSRGPRSYLFVPATRPDRLHKAFSSGADAVVVDLEDAVPSTQKDEARRLVASCLSDARPVVMRINAWGTPWFEPDLAMCRGPGVSAVMLAKAESAAVVRRVGAVAPVIALIESAAGFDRLGEIASATNVRRLAFGAIDLQLDLGMRAEFDDLIYFRSQLVLASRLAGIASPIDSPCLAIDNVQAVEREARSGRRLGFGAKLCIHPRQIAAVHSALDHGMLDLARAQRIVDAGRSADGGAFSLGGEMVDRPVIERAQRALDEASAPSNPVTFGTS